MKSTMTPERKEIEFLHLNRVMPPEQAIIRDNFIQIDREKFQELVAFQFDLSHSAFKENVEKFVQMMEKIRLAVQSNLGLSALERDKHETNHPMWVKRGNPDFPIGKNGEIPLDLVLHDAKDLAHKFPKNIPKVMIIKDTSDNDGISILYNTKFRSFSMHIASNGKVISSLKLNWKAIYDDLSPIVEGQQQALRSFTPWQRHSESNFFNSRSTNKVLSYLAEAFPTIFTIDSTNYYKDTNSELINLTHDTSEKLQTNNPNLYLILDHTLVKTPKEFNPESRQPIFAVVRRKSPIMGNVIQLSPAVYADKKLHIVLHGHQEETEITQIFHCDFESEKLYDWAWQGKKVILNTHEVKHEQSPQWKGLHLLKYSKNRDLIKQTASAPMVRASDSVMRTFWLSSFDIPTVYTEMTTIADIFNIGYNEASPLNRLEKLYYSDQATSSFRRLIFSEYELRHAKNFVFQLAIPHESSDELFFWGNDGENIGKTTRLALDIIFKLIPTEFHNKIRISINMCCPASSIERLGAGFGLRNRPDNIERIIKSIKDKYPTLFIEFKTLMLSNSDKQLSASSQCQEFKTCASSDKSKSEFDEKSLADLNKISFSKNKSLSELLSDFGADGLVWQSKPRNEEVYDMKTTLDITKTSDVNHHFKFGYSGMIATLDDDTLQKLGYRDRECPHWSVDTVISEMKKMDHGKSSDNFEVMLGRVLLGSPWLLLGRYASDQEILLLTILQCLLLREFAMGTGQAGFDLLQIHILYNLRHLVQDELRNKLMATVLEIRSATKILDVLYEQCASFNREIERDTLSLLKPSILKLKSTIDCVSSSRYSLYSTKEKVLMENQIIKGIKISNPVI